MLRTPPVARSSTRSSTSATPTADCAIIGGYVYRGAAVPALAGKIRLHRQLQRQHPCAHAGPCGTMPRPRRHHRWARLVRRGQRRRARTCSPSRRGCGRSSTPERLTWPRSEAPSTVALRHGLHATPPTRRRSAPRCAPGSPSTSTGEFAELGGRRRPRRRDRLGRPRRVGEAPRAATAGSASRGPRSTAAATPTSPSRSSSTRSTPRPTRRPGSASSARASSPRRCIQYGTEEQKRGSSRRSSRSRSCGARASRSPTPAPTSRTSRPAPCSTATSGSINGQKVWTTLAHRAEWCFVRRAAPIPESPAHKGLSYLLVPDGPARRRRSGRCAR